jgi:predicted membrane protein
LIIWILAIGVACRSFVQPNLSPALEIFGKIACAITGLIMLVLGLELMIKGSDEYIKKKLS